MRTYFRTIVFTLTLCTLFALSGHADSNWIVIKGAVNPLLFDVAIVNSGNVLPVTFETDPHIINHCYKIKGGYVIFITSKDDRFEGYELRSSIPKELAKKALTPLKEKGANFAGIHLGMDKREVESILEHQLEDDVTRLSYRSKSTTGGEPIHVVSSVVISLEDDKLVQFSVCTSRSKHLPK